MKVLWIELQQIQFQMPTKKPDHKKTTVPVLELTGEGADRRNMSFLLYPAVQET